jgi:hypothetical protein
VCAVSAGLVPQLERQHRTDRAPVLVAGVGNRLYRRRRQGHQAREYGGDHAQFQPPSHPQGGSVHRDDCNNLNGANGSRMPVNWVGCLAPKPRVTSSPSSGRWCPLHHRRPDRLHRRSATRAGGPGLGHGGVGDRHWGASSSRINSARWRRRRVSAGPAVARSASILSSIRGSATASGRRGRDNADAEAHSILSNLLRLRGDHTGALAEAERALAITPNLALAHGVMGATLVFSGRPREGLAYLETSIRLDPRDPYLAAQPRRLAPSPPDTPALAERCS